MLEHSNQPTDSAKSTANILNAENFPAEYFIFTASAGRHPRLQGRLFC